MIADVRAKVATAVNARELSPDALAQFAAVRARAGDLGGARALYDRGLQLAPNHAPSLAGKARVLRFQGDLEAAESLFDRAVELDISDFESLFLRSSLRTQSRNRNHISQLLARFDSGVPTWRDAVYLAYALAKEYEDLGDFGTAFHHMSAGALIKRRHTVYDVAGDLAMMDAIIGAFSATEIPAANGATAMSSTPIFVVGLPRTGSTLVERILGCHPMVESGGELDAFTTSLMSLMDEGGGLQGATRLDLPRATLAVEPDRLRDAYLGAIPAKLTGKRYFIDKLPLNFLNIGLMLRAMPDCRIVHVRRHPVATCFSIYKQLFDAGYPYSYDLEELAKYYVGYQRLMQHWRNIAPGRMIEVEYEALVSEPAQAIRRLVEAVGLEWDDACLAPNADRSVSTTASASQIRRPIYATSVATWRSYQQHLGGLVLNLTKAGIACT